MLDLRNVCEIRHPKTQATLSSQQIYALMRRAEAELVSVMQPLRAQAQSEGHCDHARNLSLQIS